MILANYQHVKAILAARFRPRRSRKTQLHRRRCQLRRVVPRGGVHLDA